MVLHSPFKTANLKHPRVLLLTRAIWALLRLVYNVGKLIRVSLKGGKINDTKSDSVLESAGDQAQQQSEGG